MSNMIMMDNEYKNVPAKQSPSKSINALECGFAKVQFCTVVFVAFTDMGTLSNINNNVNK